MNMTLESVLRAPLGTLLLASALLAGCGGGNGDGSSNHTPNPPAAVSENRAPVGALSLSGVLVSAGGTGDAATFTGSELKLDASGSNDPDGDSLNYTWSLISKPAESGLNVQGNANQLTIKPDAVGTYVVNVRISDSKGAMIDKRASIIVSANAVPVAVVDKSQITVLAGAAVNASASLSHDGDNDALSYTWTLASKPDGSNATISSTSAQLLFTPDIAGTYVASVKVSDGKGSNTANITITAVVSTVSTTGLPSAPLLSKYSRGLDRVVTVSTSPNVLSVTDPFAGTVLNVQLPASAKSLNLSPDGKLAAVLHEGVVSVVDIEKAHLLRSSATNGSQTEAFVTNAAFVYLVGSGNGATSGMVVINGKTGEDVSATYNRLPTGNYNFGGIVRGIYSGVHRKAFWSPINSYYDMNALSLDANGVAITYDQTKYTSGFSLYPPLFLTANEELVFTAGGNYFRADNLSSAGSLYNVTGITSLSHSASADEMILTTATREYDNSVPGGSAYIYSYGDSYRRFTGSQFVADANISLPLVGGVQSYAIAVYHSANDKHIALVQTGGAKSNASGLKYYVVVTR